MRSRLIPASLLPVVLLGFHSAVAAQTPEPAPAPPIVAATVNGEPVPLARVDAVIQAQLASTPLSATQLRALRRDVASEIVDEVLLREFLNKHGPKVEPAEIDRHLRAFSAGLAEKGQSLAGFLKETNQTEAGLRETWATILQLNGYVRAHTTDAQLRQYYRANKDYFDRVEVRVSQIVVRVGPDSSAVEKAKAREKLTNLRAEIVAGKLRFADAAKRYSQSTTAATGGDLGFIPRKGMLADEAFCRAAFALAVGEVSGVVETEYGVLLLTATGRKPGTPSVFEKCVEDVRDTFAEDYRQELVAGLRKHARVVFTIP